MEPQSLYTLGVTDPTDLQELRSEVARLNRRHAMEVRRHAQKPYMQEHEVEIYCRTCMPYTLFLSLHLGNACLATLAYPPSDITDASV